jgi:O-antigen/teichoic acid export membrane protein
MKRNGPALNLSRYAMALAGNAGSSGAQFLLSLVMLAKLPSAGFGLFAILILVAQFVFAVAAALFVAPMAAIVREAGSAPIRQDVGSSGEDAWTVLSLLQLAFGLVGALLASGIPALLGAGWIGSIVYGSLVLLGCLRQFGRISQYSRSDQRGVVASDVLFFATLLVGVLLVVVSDPSQAMVLAFASMALAHGLGIGPLASQFRDLRRQLALPGAAESTRGLLSGFKTIWLRYSGWSLLGAVSTEATANAHSYLVVGMLGPAGYGAIAASAVLTRPGNVALLALSEFERARLAQIHAANQDPAFSRRLLKTASAAIWLASVGLTFAALMWFPDLLTARGYDRDDFTLAAWGWMAVLLARCAYLPASTEMQALGAFRELAWPTVIAMPVSLLGTAVLLLFFSAPSTLVAIALGQIVAGMLIVARYRELVARRRACPCP